MGEGRGISERESVYRKKRGKSALQTAVKRQLSFLCENYENSKEVCCDLWESHKYKGVSTLKIGINIDTNMYKS